MVQSKVLASPLHNFYNIPRNNFLYNLHNPLPGAYVGFRRLGFRVWTVAHMESHKPSARSTVDVQGFWGVHFVFFGCVYGFGTYGFMWVKNLMKVKVLGLPEPKP